MKRSSQKRGSGQTGANNTPATRASRRSAEKVETNAKQVEVRDICRAIVQDYVSEKEESTAITVKGQLMLQTEAALKEEEDRARYLRLDINAGGSDKAIDSLYLILTDVEKNQDENDGEVTTIKMPSVQRIPNQDAWVPLNRNLWMGRDFDREPYFPFLGEHDDGKETAQEVYKKMKEAVSVEEYSGNSDDTDDFVCFNTHRKCTSGNVCLSLREKRTREGCRKAITQVIGSCSYVSQAVWDGISEGLNLPLEKVKDYGGTAILEHKARKEKKRKKEKRLALKSEMREVLSNPLSEINPLPGQMTAEAMLFFCRTCQVFNCEQHVQGSAAIVRDICDFTLEKRKEKLSTNETNKCLKECSYSSADSPLWTGEELSILREAYPVFGDDPCSLSITIGSKTCLQVKEMIEDETEKEKLEKLSDAENLKNTLTKMESKGRRTRKAKRDQHDEENTEDFTPCFHPGTDCIPRTCTCVQRGLRCEGTCGCTFVRYGVGQKRKGMTRIPDIAKMGHGLTGTCSNAPESCACKDGDCTTKSCACWANERTCNPDLCEDCECSLLPTKAGGRRCANVPLSASHRVRTLVGQSQIHGMGLYAGQAVKRNQMVGEYIGRLLESRTADIVGLQCDARDHTFFFDLTENTVADAGVTGSKMKFMNHAAKGSEGENCYFRHVTTRGDTAVALYSTREIEAGEEMMFNYRISECVPDWMKNEVVKEVKKKSKKSKKRGSSSKVVKKD